LVLSNYAEHEFDDAVAALANKKLPSHAPGDTEVQPTSVLVSASDQRAFVMEGGRIVAEGSAYIQSSQPALGSHVFVLVDTHDEARGLKWHAVGYHPEQTAGFPEPEDDLLKRLRADNSVLEATSSS
jgi:hypothetical protein